MCFFEGAKKPSSFNNFILQFVEELKEMVESGVQVNGKTYYIKIDGFIMDATASVKYVAPFNGYKGCRKYVAHGTFVSIVVFFLVVFEQKNALIIILVNLTLKIDL